MIGIVSPITGIWKGSVERKDEEISQHQGFREKIYLDFRKKINLL